MNKIKENKEEKRNDPRFVFLMFQLTVALIAIGFAICSKAIGGDFYNLVKEWYNSNFGEETSISQVIDAAKTETAYAEELRRNNANELCLPLSGTVTSSFGYRVHPIFGETMLHRGVDIGGDMGESVACALDGVVVDLGYGKSYGNYVEIKHSDNLTTLYAHCKEITVDVGKTVEKGETVALVGDTGDSTGPHLHFEVCINGQPINPEWLIDKL